MFNKGKSLDQAWGWFYVRHPRSLQFGKGRNQRKDVNHEDFKQQKQRGRCLSGISSV